LLTEGKNAVTNKQAVAYVPQNIRTASTILNLVSAIQFKDLYGFDTIADFKATKKELNKANRLFEEYEEYRTDRSAGEEYELIQHWGEDLQFSDYFELIKEEDYHRRRTNVNHLLSDIEADPLGLDTDTEIKEEKMERFQQQAKELGLNMAVALFMVDALKVFGEKSLANTKDIAFEIATLGTQGIDPNSTKAYKLASFPKKEFTGFQLLAYYYVSWAVALPDMVSQLQLPYEQEYKMAVSLTDNK